MKKGWSQIMVAEKLGITNTVLSNYERDYRDPDTETLRKLAELYEISTDYLLKGTDSPSNGIKKIASIKTERDYHYSTNGAQFIARPGIMSIIGTRILDKRKKLKFTQEALAIKVNLTKAAISNYENGFSSPSNETLVAIADALGVTTDYLLGRTDDPVISESKVNENLSKPKSESSSTSDRDFHFYDTDGVQFIARSSKNLSPEAFRKMQELAKRAAEIFEEKKDGE